MSEKVNVKYCKIRQQLIYISHNQPTIKKIIFLFIKSRAFKMWERTRAISGGTKTERKKLHIMLSVHIQWQIAIEALIVRINQTVHIINLFFLWVTLSLGAKLNFFFLLLLPFIFFFSFNHENRYFIHESLCALWDLLFFFFFFFF